jgi:histone-lysine N-methyltransferase SETD3
MSKKEVSFLSANDRFQKSKYEESLKIINTVKTKDYDFYLLRSKIYFSINDFYLSLQDSNQCIKLQENNIEPYEIACKNYINMFDIESAKNLLEKMKTTFPSSSKEIKKIDNLINQKEKENEENCKKFIQYKVFINYMKVIYSYGVYINKINVKWESDWMRCILASDNIKINDTLIRVPDDLLITLDTAQNSEIGKYFDEPLRKKLNSPHHCLLTAYLLQEHKKGNSSKWSFYFPFLPSSYSSFPIFYTEKEMKLLEGTQFYDIVTDKKKEIRQDYDWICEKYSGFNQYSYDEFCKFREVISSRIFGVTMKGKKNDIIAPYADLFNHRRPRGTHWAYEDDLNSFVVSAIENMSPGMEVFDSYGRKCNARFLLNYGFTIEDNEDDEIKIYLCLNNNDKRYKDKVKVLGNSNKKFTLVKNCRDEQSLLFFSWVRIMEYNGDFKGISINSPIMLKNELNMLKKVKEIMQSYLKNYKSTLEDEEKLLKEKRNSMNFNEFNCCIMRIGELRIFRYYIDLCEKCSELFNKGKGEIEKILNGKNPNFKDYEGYIKEVKGKLFID